MNVTEQAITLELNPGNGVIIGLIFVGIIAVFGLFLLVNPLLGGYVD